MRGPVEPDTLVNVSHFQGTGTNDHVPYDARVPVNAAGGSYGNWGLPRFFRRPRATGMIGRRSATGTVGTTGAC
jgi:hypothetical protein